MIRSSEKNENKVHVSNNEVISLQDPNITIPDAVIDWIIHSSCDSSVELATLSNINRKWRARLCECIKNLLINFDIWIRDEVDYSAGPQIKAMQKYHDLSGLLLPDMAFEIIRRGKRICNKEKYDDDRHLREKGDEYASRNYCLAWFAPKGIQIQAVKINEKIDHEITSRSEIGSANERNSFKKFTPSGAASDGISDQETDHRKDNGIGEGYSRISTFEKDDKYCEEIADARKELIIQTCCKEWKGYTNALDILIPFGYSTAFVKTILTYAYRISSKNYRSSGININHHFSMSSFAVRGATLARPDGFCLCWDDDWQFSNAIEMKKSKILPENSTLQQRHQYQIQSLIQQNNLRNVRRKEKMREYLPRMVMSTKIKNLDQKQDVSLHEGGRRQRCVQFLNADGSRAVCLRTPPFQCGPVRSPITIFCVGIATEDGCFLSGLKNRFELLHGHPTNKRDMYNDLSPVCLGLGHVNDTKIQPMVSSSVSNTKNDLFSIISKESYDNESSDDEDKVEIQGGISCSCQFQRIGSSQSEFECDDDNNEAIHSIVRGKLGPGLWHCYTAIFDGSTSSIRIDGVDEPCARCLYEKDSSGDSDGIDNTPILDGLTIGADHRFDIPLCCGELSDGEGEGSIAELIVFKGRLQHSDVVCLESYLMKKHGILDVSAIRNSKNMHNYPSENDEPKHGEKCNCKNIRSDEFEEQNQWEEDEWRRQAHALLTQPPLVVSGERVPLRVLAQHRSMAWARVNDVTGKYIRVSRIGSKLSTGSSDW
mmetsp:Transcript_13716/g.19607  ORF Transcript_13716/g.19607 Transcript_13716/m.19607 type:complete len:768 (+) Transcript_13716:189-2492(+)|eukprot:CAMPEP_0184868680 /NCGR_PEP_ID=MMETSP0580-20130426/31367_1 /TAXON_ID=1118495 /ORGANISM="Dactyliosolen fragilissimus" /LENGTH=767 /DNA_ID=CAMNT_0027369727 /DNA_START=175 /DNA_END=2478 /DNA_ORIENTATION=+